MPTMLPGVNRRPRDAAGRRRVVAWMASLLVVALLSACSLATLGGRGSPQGTVSVVVENRAGVAGSPVYDRLSSWSMIHGCQGRSQNGVAKQEFSPLSR